MPVAALIVVGPGIEVKPVESDSLRTDWDLGKLRTDVAVEAIFVHAEIRRGVAQPDEARQQPGLVGKEAQLLWERTSWEGVFDHRRPWRTSGSGRSGTSCHVRKSIPDLCIDIRLGFARFSAEPDQSLSGRSFALTYPIWPPADIRLIRRLSA